MTEATPSAPSIRTVERRAEVAWFSALCSDDYEFLGVPDGSLRSSYEHCGDIVRRADARGYQNILLPSGWIAGQDALSFAAAMAPQTKQINQLVALRMGEVWPPMLARAKGEASVPDRRTWPPRWGMAAIAPTIVASARGIATSSPYAASTASLSTAATARPISPAPTIGRIPTMDEYMQYANDINTMAEDVYRYLNFNEMENYIAAANTAFPVKVA